MILRDFGKRSGHKVPPVNIGAMRLPEDFDTAVELIRGAIDKGMRYIDKIGRASCRERVCDSV